MTLLDRVARAVRRHDLLPAGSRVAASVSGGSDSVALLVALRDLEGTFGIRLAGLIHVNHGLRGVASDADEQFCRDLAARLSLPIHVETVSVERVVDGDRLSPEEAARRARYLALERGRVALAADRVALGHTRDDQAETVLLRLMRGAGLDGLGGIPPRRDHFVRPLLDLGREELRAFLISRGQPWVEDATNADPAVPRNYVRSSVLPVLEAQAPRLSEALARQAEIARDEATWVAGLVNQALPRFVQPVRDGTRIDAALAAEPLGLQRRILLAALRQAGVRQPGLDEVEAVRGLLGTGPAARDLPGRVRANRIGAAVVLTAGAVRYVEQPPAFRYALPVPGEVVVAEAGATVTAAPCGQSSGPPPAGTLRVEVNDEVTAGGLFVRSWQPGDRIRPAGLGGGKKLQDVFVDRKVPRARRARLPLVVDADDRILWVPGLVLDERAAVTSRTKAVVVLKLTEQVGGPE